MKLMLKILAITVAVVWLVVTLMKDPGYVVMSRNNGAIQMSLGAFLLAAAVIFGVLYALFRLYRHLRNAPAGLSDWKRRQDELKSLKAQEEGLRLLLEGDNKRAERLMAAYAEKAPNAFINYIGAAMAAQEIGNAEKRDEYLEKARECVGADKEIAPLLLKAEMEIEEGKLTSARATLTDIQGSRSAHPEVLLLLSEVYEKQEDWDELAALLPKLRTKNAVTDDELKRLQVRAWRGRLADADKNPSDDAVRRVWDSMPKALRARPELSGKYATLLARRGSPDEAAALIEKTLKKDWRSELVRLYGKIATSDPARQYQKAESWLPKHEDDADLMLALGRLALRSELWGQARSYLEMCISMNGPREAYCELARLLEHQGENERAIGYYRRSIELEYDCMTPPWEKKNSQSSSWEMATD